MIKKLIHFLIIPCLVAGQGIKKERTDKLEAVLRDAGLRDVYSGNVFVANDTSVLFEKSMGFADAEKNIINTRETQFQIGSITKLFTKMLILQLVEAKKIRLNDHLEKYLSGFNDEISAISIQQLCDHTSGLGDYLRESGDSFQPQTIRSIQDILPYIQQEKLAFKPGTKFQYSNSGYVLLAAIIEKISGKKYGEVLKESVFSKLGMKNSGFNPFNKEEPGKAKGYLSNELTVKRDNQDLHIIGAGDGGIFSSTHDLWTFTISLLKDNRLLSDKSKLQLINSPGFPVHYSSWKEFQTKGRIMLAGGAPGISAVLGINMEKNYVMIVLSNYDEGTAEAMARRISAVMTDQDPQPFQVSPARFIYDLMVSKGTSYFQEHYKAELESANIPLDNDMIFLFAGQRFLQEKNAERAIALYSVYTKEFPEIVIAWNDLGDAYLLLNDKVHAKQCYQQALTLRPGNQRANQALQHLE